ncbi:hypothetical protein CCH79_00014212, partial [Gambusia affinis]
VLITGVLSFLQRRAQRLAIDQKLPFLKGRFGIVVPLDTIGSLSNRWSYGFAFGAVSSSVLLLFSERYIPFTVPPWARAIVYLVGALEVGLVYFPFFACLSTPFRTVGAVLGILYSIAWIVITVWDTAVCPRGEVLGKYQKIISQWPCILSLVFLLGRFIYMLVKDVRIRLQLETADPEELIDQHQVNHVKRLLRTSQQSKPLSWFQTRVYDWDPYFKFPNRIIGTAIISLIGLYTMTLADYSLSDVAFDRVEEWKSTLKDITGSCNQTQALVYMIPQIEEFIDVARSEFLYHHVRRSWLATTIFASLNSVAYTFHILVCYSMIFCLRKHLKRLWRGQKGFLPEKFHNPKSAVSVVSYLIVHFVHFLFALLFAYFLVLPIQHGKVQTMLSNLGLILLTIGMVVGLVILQVVLVQIFFLQDKMSPSDKQKPLALNNRHAFHCFNYFFFFYNVVMGISTCILRLLFSIVVGTWLVSRIDRTIMQRGYENLDAGYSTWIGMIFADHYHNNPVMVCFCQLLVSSTIEKHNATAYSSFENAPSASPLNSRARRRWALLYTLLKNPPLILRRKHHLSTASSSSPTQTETEVRAWVMASQAQNQQSALQGIPEIILTAEEGC